MNVDAQDYLRLVENNNSICFFDLESTGFKGDYDSVLVVSVLDYQGDIRSFPIMQPANDKKVVREARDYLDQFDCWVGYYSKGFDVPMMNTRLLKWGLDPMPKKHHIDLYFSLKPKLLTGRKSQAHLLSWLGTTEQKMTVGADMWNQVLTDTAKTMKVMVKRCESDCIGLRDLYEKTKHLIVEIKKG